MRAKSLADLRVLGAVKDDEAPPKPDETAAALRRLADAIEAQAGQAVAQSAEAVALVGKALEALSSEKTVKVGPKEYRIKFERDDKGRLSEASVTVVQ
jgi:hypothetical protein